MTKRLIDLDDELLADAQRALGTVGISETVRTSLRHVAAQPARTRQIDWLRGGGMESLADADQRAVVWQ